MIVTEQEAGRLWCPQARVVRVEQLNSKPLDELVGGVNRDALAGTSKSYPFPHSCRCIASHCAMWRWDDADHGHCGLAGPASRYEARPRAAEKRIEVGAHQRRLAQAERELEDITRERGASKHE